MMLISGLSKCQALQLSTLVFNLLSDKTRLVSHFCKPELRDSIFLVFQSPAGKGSFNSDKHWKCANKPLYLLDLSRICSFPSRFSTD